MRDFTPSIINNIHDHRDPLWGRALLCREESAPARAPKEVARWPHLLLRRWERRTSGIKGGNRPIAALPLHGRPRFHRFNAMNRGEAESARGVVDRARASYRMYISARVRRRVEGEPHARARHKDEVTDGVREASWVSAPGSPVCLFKYSVCPT